MADTNKIKVELIGTDKSAGKTMKAFGHDLSTVHGKLGLFGSALKNTLLGNFSKAHKQFGALSSAGKKTGGVFGFMTNMAGKAGAALPYVGAAAVALVGALVGVVYAVKGVIAEFNAWGDTTMKISRITGMTTSAASELQGMFRLTGVESAKAQVSMGMFAKNLGAAKQGLVDAAAAQKEANKTGAKFTATLNAQQKVFKGLGVNIQGKDVNQILTETRDALAGMKDPALRAYYASKLFGRGWKDLAKYLLESKSGMRSNLKFVKQLGMSMGAKAVKDFKEYRKQTLRMGLAWDAVKYQAGKALAPIVTHFLKKISKWIADNMPQIKAAFKEWGKVIEDKLVPVLDKIGTAIGDFIKWILKPGTQDRIIAWFSAVASVAQTLADAVAKIADAILWINENFHGVSGNTPTAKHNAGGRGSGGGGFTPGGHPVSSNRVSSSGSFGGTVTIIATNQAAGQWIANQLGVYNRQLARGYA